MQSSATPVDVSAPLSTHAPASGRLPDFVIIGAAKCGTTTLHEYLCRHPQVFMCTPKEPSFFAREDRYQRGVEWYASLFRQARPDQLCGESSPLYSRWPHVGDPAQRLGEHLPEARLIYIVRHPVDRAYSDYVQRVKLAINLGSMAAIEKQGYLPDASRSIFERILASQSRGGKPFDGGRFEDVLEIGQRILDTGLYYAQVERYLRHFEREQLLVLLFDDLRRDPAGVCRRLLEFIGADSSVDVTAAGTIVANSAGDYQDRKVHSALGRSLASMPGAAVLKRLVPAPVKAGMVRLLVRLGAGRQTAEHVTPPPMLPETRQRLVDFYRQPNEQLARFIQRELSHWNA